MSRGTRLETYVLNISCYARRRGGFQHWCVITSTVTLQGRSPNTCGVLSIRLPSVLLKAFLRTRIFIRCWFGTWVVFYCRCCCRVTNFQLGNQWIRSRIVLFLSLLWGCRRKFGAIIAKRFRMLWLRCFISILRSECLWKLCSAIVFWVLRWRNII